MAAPTLPYPPLGDGAISLRGRHSTASQAVAARIDFEPVIQREEAARFVDDIYFARMRGG